LQATFPNNSFVFGQFKDINFNLHSLNNKKIDKILLISSNPLSTGFLVKEIKQNEHVDKAVVITIRATLSHKETDSVDLLFAFQSSGYVRLVVFNYEFKIGTSFKTKCVHEDLGNNFTLIGIDIFDSKEASINPMTFKIKSLALMSESYNLTSNFPFSMSINPNLLNSQKSFTL